MSIAKREVWPKLKFAYDFQINNSRNNSNSNKIAAGIRASRVMFATSSSTLNQRTTDTERCIAERRRVQYVIECSRRNGT